MDLSLLRVLHVEDDKWISQIVEEYLLAFGVGDVRSARDGYSAYTALRRFPADIVITDWVMAPIDGFEFTQMIRNAPDSPNPFVPIIMLTNHSTRDQVIEARDIGVTEYLIKPITPDGLRDRIVSVIKNPRPFIRGATYFGPDRRRIQISHVANDRRRD